MAAAERFKMWWDDHAAVARVVWAPDSVCGLNEARALTEACEQLGRGAIPLLVDMRGMKQFKREAREHFAKDQDQGGVTAIALMAESAVTKMMANFFIGMRRQAIAIQLFTDEAEAIRWLQGQKPNAP